MVRGKGTGFVSLADYEEDVVIPTESLSFGLDGDVVRIALTTRSPEGRQQGEVREVVEPKHKEFVGSIDTTGDGPVLVPDNRRIHIRIDLPHSAREHTGQKVVAQITKWSSPHMNPRGEITDVLGPIGSHETEMQAIIRSGGFSGNFPPAVEEAAQTLYKNRDTLFEKAENDPKRRDYRDRPTVTIDPADAKDFDDALSFRPCENGNVEVGIHIADVSYYVEEGGVIDMEARERGTSVYLVDRVIPMLPEVLSNDLCSLRPNEDRLAFSAVFELDSEGRTVHEWYGQTIIHSDKRLTYAHAQQILDEESGEHYEVLSSLMDISRKLRKRRYQNGAIAFEQPEVQFELDEDKKPIRVYTKERTETMLMIEDFMLLANKSVAEHIHRRAKENDTNAAFVYRVHDSPDTEKIEELAIFLRALGYELKTHKGVVKATDINRLLEEVEGTPEENLIKVATIRSMAKAVYTTKNIGHFGLAFKYYTHFTSPIRRYPDLMVHRLLRKHLDGSPIGGKEIAKYERLSIQSSEREMSAVAAERDSIKFKQVEYMQDKVGEEFTGVVTGVSDWGVYVEEKESRAEGMIRLASMKSDYFEHQASKYRVKGDRTGKTYSLGDEIRVRLTRADPDERQLDFELSEEKRSKK